jgi:hypothetical protein
VAESNSDRKLTSAPPISGAQLRAARALLKWSVRELSTFKLLTLGPAWPRFNFTGGIGAAAKLLKRRVRQPITRRPIRV